MSEPARKLQIIATEQAGFCDPESGVCHLPAGQHADDGAQTAGAPATPASRNVSKPVR
jgi:hypothetical protein